MSRIVNRYALAGCMLAIVGAILVAYAATAEAATALPHGGNGSGRPYNNGQIQNNNYTYYVTERDTGMSNWENKTGRRYIDGWTTGEVMTQYVVYSGSQQDTDLSNWFQVPSCHSFGLYGYRAFHYGHGSLNNDKAYSVICINIDAYGYTTGFEDVSLATRKKGMTHEMGHSLHLADDSTSGTMNTCWCYNIATAEANLVNSIYSSLP